ncbi:Two-component sensor histidine kinase, contains HisKA and HATPase domains [Selenomonas ruminantium]|uniref:histidine kinase n=1 Tax=Selenomonas ruminantium TaxID=971 RepID=A0A1M6XDQ2_SELRU|nr:histidine kinase N-terminal domain-containing protein [Selenomonas ruminantium]SHL03979.1 Two-component sensor histidine kinase, contains HisKA and HATPase domains [Selenomonas ruminantium]
MNMTNHNNTYLTKKQINTLDRLKQILPFLADLLHGHGLIYTSAAEPNRLRIIASAKPHTVYVQEADDMAETVVDTLSEPLVTEVFHSGQFVHGKREQDYGHFVDMYVFPIMDNNTVIAVLSVEVDKEHLNIDDFSYLIKTTQDVIRYAVKDVDLSPFAPLSASDGLLITDQFSRIIFANDAAQRIYRVLGVGSLKGCHLFDRQLTRHVTREAFERERPWQKELTAGGLYLIRRQIDLQAGGTLLRRIVVLSDMTEIRAKEQEIRIKSAVIQEIHHRVKNNLQTVASLLRLQARRSGSEEVKSALSESVNRVLSIAAVHDFLSRQRDESMDLKQVMTEIFAQVKSSMVASDFELQQEFCGESVSLPPKYASSLALVLNELIINAIEHAFAGRQAGLVGLRVELADELKLDFYDDGCGLPADFHTQKRRSLGLSIIRTLIEGDLGGSFWLENDASGRGTHAYIVLPKPELSGQVVASLEE